MPKFRDHDYSAFLFDMDGTMVDSSAAVERVWGEWAERHGVNRESLLAACHGVRSSDLVRQFGPSGLDVAHEVSAIMSAELLDVDGVLPIDGIGDFVASLTVGSWAVVTSAPRALAKVRLAAGRLPIPKVLIAAEDVERGKPHPDGFLLAAQKLDVSIEDCLVFEDSPAGIAAAKAAGAHVAIVGSHASGIAGNYAINDYLH